MAEEQRTREEMDNFGNSLLEVEEHAPRDTTVTRKGKVKIFYRLPWQPLLAEMVGTFLFVFVGTSSVCSYPNQTLLGVATAHGLGLCLVIYGIGAASGGHVNPAVSFATFLTKDLHWLTCIGYISSQFIGAALASAVLDVLLPAAYRADGSHLGAFQVNGINKIQAFFYEMIMTFMLVMVVYSTGIRPPPNRKTGKAVELPPLVGLFAPISIGIALIALILIGGALTGACVNPARYFGPALMAGFWDAPEVYMIAPFVGGALASLFYTYVIERYFKSR